MFSNPSRASLTAVSGLLFSPLPLVLHLHGVSRCIMLTPCPLAPRRYFASQTAVSLVQGDDADTTTAVNTVSCLAEARDSYSETTRIQHENLFVPRVKLARQ